MRASLTVLECCKYQFFERKADSNILVRNCQAKNYSQTIRVNFPRNFLGR